jgi:sorbitol/mannitol transport system substrate-binding protein
MIKKTYFLGLLTATILAGTTAVHAETRLTIATVNNGDMIVMQRLSNKFEQANPDIKLDWVVLEENVLRQRVITDIATKGGQYDVMTIGTYEVPIWAKQGWIKKFDNLPASYDVNDVLKPVREGLSYNNELYALPFYAESSMTYYRKDLVEKTGMTMPEQPTCRVAGLRYRNPAPSEPDMTVARHPAQASAAEEKISCRTEHPILVSPYGRLSTPVLRSVQLAPSNISVG